MVDSVSPIDGELQRSMYHITELLGTLRVCTNNLRQLLMLEAQIAAAAGVLEYLIQDSENAMCGYSESLLQEFELGGAELCLECMRDQKNGVRARNSTEVAALNRPIWEFALEFALQCTHCVAAEWLDRGNTSKRFPSCLIRLQRQLRRLQRALPPVMSETEIRLKNQSNLCGHCGKAIEASSNTGENVQGEQR